jgi:hypothetical protein
VELRASEIDAPQIALDKKRSGEIRPPEVCLFEAAWPEVRRVLRVACGFESGCTLKRGRSTPR